MDFPSGSFRSCPIKLRSQPRSGLCHFHNPRLFSRASRSAARKLLRLSWIERIFDVGVAVALPDYLLLDEQVVSFPEDVGQQSAIPVMAGRHGLDLQTDPLALEQGGRELAGLLAEILDGLARVLGLGRVHADERDGLGVPVDLNLDGVAVDDSDDRVVRMPTRAAGASFDLAVSATGAGGAGWAGCLAGAFLRRVCSGEQ